MKVQGRGYHPEASIPEHQGARGWSSQIFMGGTVPNHRGIEIGCISNCEPHRGPDQKSLEYGASQEILPVGSLRL